MGISEQSTLLCEQKLLTSRQIFRYAVPARTVTIKHWQQSFESFVFILLTVFLAAYWYSCLCLVTLCRAEAVMCGDWSDRACIPAQWRCNRINRDCPNNSDEDYRACGRQIMKKKMIIIIFLPTGTSFPGAQKLAKCRSVSGMVTMGLGNSQRVGQAYGIKPLNCHRNPLVQKRGFSRIGCTKRCSPANLCQKKLCLICQRTQRLNSHWYKHVARMMRTDVLLLLLVGKRLGL